MGRYVLPVLTIEKKFMEYFYYKVDKVRYVLYNDKRSNFLYGRMKLMKRNALIRCAAWLLTLCTVIPLVVSCESNEHEKVTGDTTTNDKTVVTDAPDETLAYEYDLYDYKEYECPGCGKMVKVMPDGKVIHED